jgi:hypothetical protein
MAIPLRGRAAASKLLRPEIRKDTKLRAAYQTLVALFPEGIGCTA